MPRYQYDKENDFDEFESWREDLHAMPETYRDRMLEDCLGTGRGMSSTRVTVQVEA